MCPQLVFWSTLRVELHRLIDSGQVTSPYLHIGGAVTCCLLKITKVLFYTRVSKE